MSAGGHTQRRPRFALRTIRNGAVRIDGRTFRPDEHRRAYDGRLDGTRYAFGLYYRAGELQDFVSLWGTEDFYRDCDGDWPGAECVDGYFNWEWWRTGASRTPLHVRSTHSGPDK